MLVADAVSRKRIEWLSHSAKGPARVVLRAQIVSLASKGVSNGAIAKQLHSTPPTVRLCLRRFRELGLQWIEGTRQLAGRPRRISAQAELDVVEAYGKCKSLRKVGAQSRISPSQVKRLVARARAKNESFDTLQNLLAPDLAKYNRKERELWNLRFYYWFVNRDQFQMYADPSEKEVEWMAVYDPKADEECRKYWIEVMRLDVTRYGNRIKCSG